MQYGPFEIVSAWIFSFWIWIFGGVPGLPLGVAPEPEDPMFSRVAPDSCLMYTSWAAQRVGEHGGETNPAVSWLKQPEIQKLLEKLLQSYSRTQTAMGGGEIDGKFRRQTVEFVQICLRSQCAFFISEVEQVGGRPFFKCGFMVDLKHEVDQARQCMELFGQLSDDIKKVDFSINGLPCQRFEFDDVFEWTIRDSCLLIGIRQGSLAGMLKNLETDTPKWLTEIRNSATGDRICSTSYFDFRLVEHFAIDHSPWHAWKLVGMDSLRTIGSISELTKDGFVTHTKIRTEDEPKGMIACFGDQSLSVDLLKKIPSAKSGFVATKLNSDAVWELIRKSVELGGNQPSFDNAISEMEMELDIDIREIIESVGSHAVLTTDFTLINPSDGWLVDFAIDDAMVFDEAFEKIAVYLEELAKVPELRIEFRKFTVGPFVYRRFRDTLPRLSTDICFALADGHCLFSLSDRTMRRRLRSLAKSAEDGQAADDQRDIVDWCRTTRPSSVEGPVAVSYVDVASIVNDLFPFLEMWLALMPDEEFDFDAADIPEAEMLTRDIKPNLTAIYRTGENELTVVGRQSFPGCSPISSAAAGWLMALPNFGNIRVRYEIEKTAGKVHEIGRALKLFEEKHGAYPATFSIKERDKPLLSWRVHLLPFLGHEDLYQQFRLDEPWDSEHNKALIEKIPDVYQHNTLPLKPGYTSFLAAVGDSTVFVAPEQVTGDSNVPIGTKKEDVSDVARTASFIEVNAENSVQWTRPADFNVDVSREDFNKRVAGIRVTGFFVGFWDTSTHCLNINIHYPTLQRLLAREK